MSPVLYGKSSVTYCIRREYAIVERSSETEELTSKIRSTGSCASLPYMRKNGMKLVDEYEYLCYKQSKLSKIQLRGLSLAKAASIVRRVQLNCSTELPHCGWYGNIHVFLI